MTTPDSGENSHDKAEIQSEAELIGRIIQSEQKLSEYFTTIITKSVTDQIEKRNMARLRAFGVVSVMVISVIIPAVAVWIRGAIASGTESAVEARFSSATERLEEHFGAETRRLEANFHGFLEGERRYLTFANEVIYLADRPQVPINELEEALTQLEIIAESPEMMSRTDFPSLLDLAIQTAIKNDYAEVLRDLEGYLQRIPEPSPRMVLRLARHYGHRILGQRFTSRKKQEDAAEKFRRYLDEAEGSPGFVRLLALQLMVEQEVSDASAIERTEAVQLFIQELEVAQQARFIAETVRYTDPDFRDLPPTPRNERISASANRFVAEHRAFFVALLEDEDVQQTITRLAAREDNMENMGMAGALRSFQKTAAR